MSSQDVIKFYINYLRFVKLLLSSDLILPITLPDVERLGIASVSFTGDRKVGIFRPPSFPWPDKRKADGPTCR